MDLHSSGDHSPDGQPPRLEAIQAAVTREFVALLNRPLAPGLYVVATPIGNLGDVTLRALAVLAIANAVYCEDTRHSRKLLERYAIRRPLRSFHEHNESRETLPILAQLAQGLSVALISDAGTPLVSDPGYKLVRDVIAQGNETFAVPGPSAVLAALTTSGLPSDCFTFVGFLPPKHAQRQARLQELAHAPGTLLFFEAPGRVEATLKALAEAFGNQCPAAMAREITKLHEEKQSGTLEELCRRTASQTIRGEVVIAVAPQRSPAQQPTDASILAELTLAHQGSMRDQIDAVALRLQVPRKRVYDLAVRGRKD